MDRVGLVVINLFPVLALCLGFPLTAEAAASPEARLAKTYASAVEALNKAHARKPGKTKEPELGLRLSKNAKAAMARLLKMKDSPALFDALVVAGMAALDLDLMKDHQAVHARLARASPDHAAKLGIAFSRPRFILRGLGGLDRAYLEKFAKVLDAVLGTFDQLFGFREWSKVPGKKLRFRVHLVPEIKRPPYFAPEFPFHSEVYLPVIDSKVFRSPTSRGQFLFYALGHELGHVFAMWGNFKTMEDHHAWAHYTGVTIVEHMSQAKNKPAFMKHLKDVRWRSLSKERERLKTREPSLADKDGVLSLLIRLHDAVGPAAIGKAMNLLDKMDRRLRINKVRYYTFKEFKDALLKTLKSKKAKRMVAAWIR